VARDLQDPEAVAAAQGEAAADPALPLLLAVQAHRLAPTATAGAALLDVVAGATPDGVTPGDPIPGDVPVQLPLATARQTTLAVTRDGDAAGVVDVVTGEQRPMPATAPATLTPDGALIVSADGAVIDVETGEPALEPPVPAPASTPVFDASGRIALYATRGDPATVAIVDLTTGEVAETRLTAPVCLDDCRSAFVGPSLAISPDGSWAAVRVGGGETLVGLRHTGGTLAEIYRNTLDGAGFVRFLDDDTLQAHDGTAVHTFTAATGGSAGPAAAALHGGPWRASGAGQLLVTPGVDCEEVRVLDPDSFAVLADVPVARDFVEGGCDDVDAVWMQNGGAVLLQARDRCDDIFATCVTRLPTDPVALTARACEVAGRDLTRDEWQRYLPAFEFEPTCPAVSAADTQGPAGPDAPTAEATATARAGPTSSDPATPTAGPTTPTQTPTIPTPASPSSPTGQPDPSSGAGFVVDGEGLGHSDLSLGAPMAQAVEELTGRLGPVTSTGAVTEADLEADSFTSFRDGDVMVYASAAEGTAVVVGLRVRLPGAETAAGLRIGDPAARVAEVHPDAELVADFTCGGADAFWVLAPDVPGGPPIVIAGAGGAVAAVNLGQVPLC
jgi:hypothetical protein